MALAAGLVLLAAMPANAQQGGVSDDTNEKVVSINGFSSDTSYIVYLSWQPNDTDANIFDISIHDSATGARLSDIKYDVVLYKSGELVTSSQQTDQTTTRRFYDFEDQSQYAVRVSNIEGSGEWRLCNTGDTRIPSAHICLGCSIFCWHNSYAQATPGSLV